jgi:maleylpyruvate isomerase
MAHRPPALYGRTVEDSRRGALMGVEEVERMMRLVDDASVALIGAAAAMSDTECREPSRLPGWSRGHVLTHVARNADALVNLLTAARTGNSVPMYASPQARDADIETGADRPAGELVADLRESTARLQEAVEALGAGGDWQAVVEWRRGRRRPIADVPRARLTEVALHHVDLGSGFELDDLADPVADALIAESLARLRSLPEAPAVAVRPAGASSSTTTSDTSEEVVVVTGSRAALVGWLTGRAEAAGLEADGPLPELAAWG